MVAPLRGPQGSRHAEPKRPRTGRQHPIVAIIEDRVAARWRILGPDSRHADRRSSPLDILAITTSPPSRTSLRIRAGSDGSVVLGALVTFDDPPASRLNSIRVFGISVLIFFHLKRRSQYSQFDCQTLLLCDRKTSSKAVQVVPDSTVQTAVSLCRETQTPQAEK